MKNKKKGILVFGVLLLLAGAGLWLKHHQREKHLAELKARKNMNGLVAWWPGDGDATDIISGETAILENHTGFAPGIRGLAFDFDPDPPTSLRNRAMSLWYRLAHFVGVKPPVMRFPQLKHVRIKDRPELRLTNGMTLEAWIYPTRRGGYLEVIGKWTALFPDPNAFGSYTFGPVPDGRVYVGVTPVATGPPGSSDVYSTSVVPLNAWTHVAGTYDGTALHIYVNGRLENSLAYAADIYPAVGDVGIGAVVGNAAPGQCFSPFFGRIADASIYNRALSPDEVRKDYERSKPGDGK